MRVHLVSDVHGNFDALARAGRDADVLLILGDLIDYVDYHHHDQGILGTLFGADKVAVYAKIRREGRSGELNAYSQTLWDELDDPTSAVQEVVRGQYKAAFAAIDKPTYLIPGNVDVPELWPEFMNENVRLPDGEVVELGGMRFGFVGGAILDEGATLDKAAPWVPHLREKDDFDASVDGLTNIDVLCSHVPPALPELSYDVVARRVEFGSVRLRDFILERQPSWSFFGHVHQPLSPRLRVGKTECRNLGYFKRTERAFILEI
jgi:Icc-related predicted phosphoesterase